MSVRARAKALPQSTSERMLEPVTMGTTTVPRTFAEQHALNRRAWELLVNDPAPGEVLEKIETDRDGNRIMSPPPKRPHARRANRIAKLLGQLLPEGVWQIDDTVSTPEGVKMPDVVWYGPARQSSQCCLRTWTPLRVIT